ncbi:MAG: hypoxanthine phosphoribosyltransferase [Elusimicrobia bacterium]|nr:hypoxanthine phosphoribosyltransferase [Elusimicrobiota bacterium]
MEILLTAEAIQKRVREMSEEISRDYRGKNLLLIGVLNGSFLFLADLVRNLSIPCAVDFISLQSYNGASSTGAVRTLLDLRREISDYCALIVEDIVDTGLTLSYLLNTLQARRPKSLEICVLADKAECRKVPVPIRYVGFTVPNRFLVGYGLDYEGQYRQLPYIGVLDAP